MPFRDRGKRRVDKTSAQVVDEASTSRSRLLRHFILLFAAATALAAAPAPAQTDDRFDDRGVDRYDRAPDWNYRRGEPAGKGAYYDGGRYGPRGLLRDDIAFPWLVETGLRVAGRDPGRANRRFAKLADSNGDARLTDAEIAAALATAGGRSR